MSSVRDMAAGAAAGLAVDLSLFPLDTLKTRLQRPGGLGGVSGLRGLYAGVPSVMVGSAPGAALFFLAYEESKRRLSSLPAPTSQALAACVGESVACLVRVPTELIKQRSQAFPKKSLPWVLRRTLGENKGYLGFYRGFFSTLSREIPFSLLQFPLWEALKARLGDSPLESAFCGSLAGAVSGAATTPLDVAKTRIMLADEGTLAARGRVLPVLRQIWAEGGTSALFAGAVPRAAWLALGGLIFFGAYETAAALLNPHRESRHPLLFSPWARKAIIEAGTDLITGKTEEEARGPPYVEKLAQSEEAARRLQEEERQSRLLDLLLIQDKERRKKIP